MYARIARSPILRAVAPVALDRERRARLERLGKNFVVHDLRKGIPFPDGSASAVYHSHLLEHLDRDVADSFMTEVRRVLRAGGVQRIVVPDLELACRRYLDHLESGNPEDHDEYVAAILEQSVRREASGTSTKPRVRRALENLLLGDARKRGETHQWMYDFKNLSALLSSTGFRDITRRAFDESSIPNWNSFGLDRTEDGNEYKPGSLYVEAVK
jgi:SAM-dependent methyltransferase